ncbi:iron-containing alcohol dehydrogenase [Candidatus Uhrbacteria bacterium]|nr:iron-containing alcohol dehydrogenase [Candidatus Uhrbacteria bacterium]
MIDEIFLNSFIPQAHFPRSVYFGSGSLDFLKKLSGEKVLFVISANAFKRQDELIRSILGKAEFVTHSGEPKTEDREELRERCRKNGSKYLAAIGGGSVIDLVKIVKDDLKIQMIAVPTTIGSGAEVSRFALLSDVRENKKIVVSSPRLLPEAALIDARFFLSHSKEQIALHSIDALSHAVEALLSKMSNSFSDALALGAIRGIYDNLREFAAIRQPADGLKILEQLKLAATLAGLAQSSAATGLNHALAHYFGAKYDIPHARAVAMFFLDVLEFNSRSGDVYKKFDKLKMANSQNILPVFSGLYKELGLVFDPLPLKEEEVIFCAEAVRKDICALANPIRPGADEVAEIIRRHI